MKHQLDFEKPIAELQNKLAELKKHPEAHSLDISVEQEVALIEKKLEETKRQIFANLSAWDRVKIARHPKRPFTLDYLATSPSPSSPSCTATGCSPRTAPWLAASPASAGIKSWSSAPKKAATPRRISCATSVRRTRKATARRCG